MARSSTIRGGTLPVLLLLLGTTMAENGNRQANTAAGAIKGVGMLYPVESETREVKSLDGFWDFAVPPSNDTDKGTREEWHSYGLSAADYTITMPVPSSYNDITTSIELRDYLGPVWYERNFFAPYSWKSQRVFVRFGSVNYHAKVWINGELVTSHALGHLPFESEITPNLRFGKENRITVSVDNTLDDYTIPQGWNEDLRTDHGNLTMQDYNFDFFNYAGIHRPVLLHTKPRIFVSDITITTELNGDEGFINYDVEVSGLDDNDTVKYDVSVRDADGDLIDANEGFWNNGTLIISSVKPWWPIGMNSSPAYLYTLSVVLRSAEDIIDVYRLPVGIRTISWNETTFLINGKPVYLRGFGRHEDASLRGRGLDLVTVARDYELLKWVGANAYRTSHYPYSDEVMDMADRTGVLIIDESPAVDLDIYSDELLEKHKEAMAGLIRRDKNRPSVVIWSLANEPRTDRPKAAEYFTEIANFTRELDPTRPTTIVIATTIDKDNAGQCPDIISFNRYNSWYSHTGRTDMIQLQVVEEATAWHKKFNKPIIMSEYGADTVPGMHELPGYVWSEEYQDQVMSNHFRAFDNLRERGFFVGEFIWNFADFRTSQKITRVGGNKKGIFTRDREPKMVAHLVRQRYHSLAEELDHVKAPDDLYNYVSRYSRNHVEL